MGQNPLHPFSFPDPLLIPLLGPFGYWICAPITLYFRDLWALFFRDPPLHWTMDAYSTGSDQSLLPNETPVHCFSPNLLRHTRPGFSPLTLYLRDSLGIFVCAKHFEQL